MRIVLMAMLAVLVGGCASRESPLPVGSYQTVAAAQPPAPMTPFEDYRINALDEVRVDVFGERELSLERVPVGPNGRIVLPLAGEVVAQGRTATELSREIARQLNRFLRDPQVAVNVVQFTSQRVTITGAVRQAGIFPGITNMTLLDAIALGQGLNDYAKASEILVFREQGGQRYVARFDLGPIQTGQAANPRIQSGDIVVVGYSASRRFFADVIPVLPVALGVFLALAQ